VHIPQNAALDSDCFCHISFWIQHQAVATILQYKQGITLIMKLDVMNHSKREEHDPDIAYALNLLPIMVRTAITAKIRLR
jgi:hypothetical protein